MKQKHIIVGMCAVAMGLAFGAPQAHAKYDWKAYFRVNQVKAVKEAVTKTTINALEGNDEDWRGVIRGRNIKDGTIDKEKLSDSGCAAGQVLKYDGKGWVCAEDTIGAADNSVTSAKIVDGAIIATDLASNSVTNVKIVDGAINSAKIADSSIDTADIADGAVTAAKVDNTVAKRVVYTGTIDTTVANPANIPNSKTDGNGFYYKDIPLSEYTLANPPSVSIYFQSPTMDATWSFLGSNMWEPFYHDEVYTDGHLWLEYYHAGSYVTKAYKIVVNY